MANGEEKRVGQQLARQAHLVGWASEQDPWREFLRWISRGRLGQLGWQPVPELDTPWQDTLSPLPERNGWRQRAANLHHELHRKVVFSVDYRICRPCRVGWVEGPYTEPQYQRCGLASAGLAALRFENPGLAWHTLGGHFSDSRPFWKAVGEAVPGGYQKKPLCPHLNPLHG